MEPSGTDLNFVSFRCRCVLTDLKPEEKSASVQTDSGSAIRENENDPKEDVLEDTKRVVGFNRCEIINLKTTSPTEIVDGTKIWLIDLSKNSEIESEVRLN